MLFFEYNKNHNSFLKFVFLCSIVFCSCLNQEKKLKQEHLATTETITNSIKALADVSDAYIIIVWPNKSQPENLNIITACAIITPISESDIKINRNKIEEIHSIFKNSIPDIKDENILIVDNYGIILNEFKNYWNIDYR